MKMDEPYSHAECVLLLAHLLISKVEEGWLMIMEDVPQCEKMT